MANIDSASLPSVQISSIRPVSKAEELRNLLDRAYEAQQEEKKQEKLKDDLLKQANTLRQKLRLPGKIESDLWTTVHIVAARATIKKEKLLEHGVSMDVIEECTDIAPYESFYVQGKKQAK